MDSAILGAFVFTYIGMALGRMPGLKIDRTGMALLAVVALLALGRIEVGSMGAAIDLPTLLLLFALMIVSAQFAAAGFYRAVAARITSAAVSPAALLALTVGVSGLLSAVLANDIIAFAMAPIIAEGIRRRGLDPRPFLIGLAGGCNAGSAATIIGNPQNILIGQTGGLDFWRFLLACAPPAVIGMAVAYGVVRWVWRDALRAVPPGADAGPPPVPDRWQTAKGVAAVLVLAFLFTTDLPHEIGALVVAGFLLASRRLASRDMLGAVDWHLLVLFACLFIVTGAFAATGLAQDGVDWLTAAGWLPDRLMVLGPLMLAASNSIGNVPAVMLLLSVWTDPGEGALYALAVLSTLAGNLLIVGSLANIIIVERAASVGVRLGFADHARCGIPMTLLSMALAALWLWAAGWMAW
ncbi:anion transporter [Telmatospirillum sp. J64-1]|uniref:anion transporter n=1 Tax=Telmatospirillum sp. J64-1 TaxID=2502183 RepID=UPI00115C5F35|nr:anion transporter [Telmatospirillum sp. J64-1]